MKEINEVSKASNLNNEGKILKLTKKSDEKKKGCDC
jgi:hypothetical protein